MPPEGLEEALGRLPPTQRALLELSLRREVADPALAELLRTDVKTVAGERTASLETLAHELEIPVAEVEEALISHWRAAAEAAGEQAPEAETPGGRRSRRGVVWAGVAAVVAVVVLLVALSGGDDEEPEGRGGAPVPAEPPAGGPAEEPGGAVELEAVAGASGVSGVARIVESGGQRRLRLTVSGLSGGLHEAWLYNSIVEARSLAQFEENEAKVDIPLPEGFESFRFVDISAEPDDGNENHSGASLLRAPIDALSG